MAVKIKWRDNNYIERGHRLYKSNTYFTKDNLPAPLVDLSPDVTEYNDTAGNTGENWYIVSAYTDNYEVFSSPFIPGLSTAFLHDVFGDGSIVATYNFDNSLNDIGGNYNLTRSDSEEYSEGVIFNSARFNSSSMTQGSFPSLSETAISYWIKMDSVSGKRFGHVSVGELSIGSEYEPYNGTPRDWDIVVIKGYGRFQSEGAVYLGFLPDEWHHVYIDSSINLYVDNNPVSFNRNDITWENTTTPLLLGDFTDYNSKLEGNMDQVRIFNRVLTEKEINILYLEGNMGN